MIIRKALPEDLPGIIEVLKAGLGESLIKKNIDNWKYKHELNPFGKSIVWVAEMNDKIVGVRAFMRWQWQLNDQKFTAWRAVDTATHPDYQRRGIFKKLTLKALEEAQSYPDSFIFNTPNQNSKPGYLKMGWKIVERVTINLTPGFLIPKYYYASSINIKNEFHKIEELCDIHNERMKTEKKFFTPKSKEYIIWRYQTNPLQQYQIFSNDDIFMAYYVKKHTYFKELRVAELLQRDSKSLDQIRKILAAEARKNKCLIISNSQKVFKISKTGKWGPELTVHPLKNNAIFEKKILNSQNWNPTIGDLELF